MQKILFIFLMALLSPTLTIAQFEIGIEWGHHISNYIPQKQSFNQPAVNNNMGLKAGFFIEQDCADFLAIRINSFYKFRYFVPGFAHHLGRTYGGIHCFSLPIKAIFKPGKIVHLGLGAEPMIISGPNTPNKTTSFHFGLCTEIAFRIKKLMRLSFYCNYDFVPVQFDNYPKSNNLTAGVAFAVAFKKFKKRRIIYSPG
ncbi:hypothetical protein [Aureispira anguillae]|uniref:Outer membrane protein beta-barrel domain-containing protein n=1 Tax=Aureispira anguillae TaxID=2864201 RepID=A0A916DPU1_9BACT|nr:hypothetical protein [Aureispira anguillae]BDS10341.1 hypothetical protein AsAng_0010490 [Aureispira anguillae]